MLVVTDHVAPVAPSPAAWAPWGAAGGYAHSSQSHVATVESSVDDTSESKAEVKAQLGEGLALDAARVSVNSRFFEVAGRLRLDERVLEERSLLERRPGGRSGNVVVVRREKTSYVTDLR